MWQQADNRPAQATPDGRFLVFASSADLTAGDESRNVPQLFEYDAGTEKLIRVSIGQDGTYHGDGAVATFRNAPQIPAQSFTGADLPTGARFKLTVSDDGSTVFFTSAAGLTPEATEGATSVYEYRDGGVYLISDGRDASLAGGTPTVQLAGATPTGGDAFFLTVDPLVPQDNGETQVQLYDAREEGGFPAPALAPGCAGETCRGAMGATPQLQQPGSINQSGGDNLPPPVEPKPAVTSKTKPLTRTQALAKARKLCKKVKAKKKRLACEKRARRAFGAKAKAQKSAHPHRKVWR